MDKAVSGVIANTAAAAHAVGNGVKIARAQTIDTDIRRIAIGVA